MAQDTLAETIQSDLLTLISDPGYQRFLARYLENGEADHNASWLIKTARGNFLAGKETALEDECQRGDLHAITYAGYDAASNHMRFWPTDERAQVVYLAGYAALEGHRVPLRSVLPLLL